MAAEKINEGFVRYKICTHCTAFKYNNDTGEYGDEVNLWDENDHKSFVTVKEAEECICNTYDLKQFEYNNYNGYDELQGSRIEKEEGEYFAIDTSIRIVKVVTYDVKFKKLKRKLK